MNRHRDRSSVSLLALLSSCLLGAVITACGGGGGGGGSSSDGSQTAVLLSSSPASEDLSSLSVTVTEVELVDDRGGATPNLLPSPTEVDLLALSGQHALLALGPAPSGVYAEVRATIDPQSIRARDANGNVVDIPVAHASASVLADRPIVVGPDGIVPFGVEIPILDCLTDGPSGREFSLVIRVPELPNDVVLDVVVGRVTRELQGEGRFVIEVVRGDDETPVGPITVAIDSQTVLLDDDGREFPSAGAFFDDLKPGDLVEVNGQLRADGTLLADSVEIEDRHGRPVAQIEATVLKLDLARNLLEARIDHIKSGAKHVHDAIGDDPTFLVTWDSSTVFVDHGGRRDDHGHHRGRDRDKDEDKHKDNDDDNGDDKGGGKHDDDQNGDDQGHHDDDEDDDDGHGSASESDLAIGQRVEMKFLDFVSPPFLAHKIQIEERAPEFEGTIHEVPDSPHSLVVHLAAHDPAVIGGLVASDTTDVRVTLDHVRSIYLDLPGEPEIEAGRLLVGLRVRLRGDLSGDPAAPTIDASAVCVAPGELFGTLQSLDGERHSGVIDVTRVDEPFGGSPLPDPLSFTLARCTRFSGAAENERELIDLFLHLEPGQHIAVRALGLADPDSPTAKIYDLRTELR